MRWIVVLFFLPALVAAQGQTDFSWTNEDVAHYLPAYYSVSGEKNLNFDRLQRHLEKLSKKRQSNPDEVSFLKHVFTKTHERFLKEYRATAAFDEMFHNGVYNCMTGTALFALVLEHLHYDYQVIETNYHIFLMVSAGGKQVLIETTDPVTGFVSDEKEIAQRIASYKFGNTALASNDEKIHFRYKASLCNSIDLGNIQGLLHFNMAVAAYNNQDIGESIEQLSFACSYYNSERMEEFSKIIMLTILEGKFSSSDKDRFFMKLRSIKRNDSFALSRIN